VRVVTAAQMRAIDAAAVARDGEVALMRAAGEAIARLIDRYAEGDGPIVALAGDGNNGGDAYAALAAYAGSRRTIVFADLHVDGSPARRDARIRARLAGVEERALPADAATLNDAALILEGVLGANARLPLDARSAAAVATLAAGSAPVLALDVPAGVDPTSGATDPGGGYVARATIALGRPKRGCVLDPGRDHTGDLYCAPLGMRDADADGIDDPSLETLTDAEFAALLPVRSNESDKRASGAPLIVAGSTQFPGAAILCATGAARAGAGYVTVAAPEGAAAALRAHLIEQVVVTYDEADPEAAVATIVGLTNRCDAIGIGPGLGLSDAFGAIVNGVLAKTDRPVVADASGLYHLAKRLGDYRGHPMVVTPHAGEFARLSGGGTIASGERLPRLRTFVDSYGIVTLLKGRTTLIGSPQDTFANPTGTNALATAGTGDVLTGVIATLLAQGLSPADAARAGAYWHGRAGSVAAARRPRGVIAGDVADALGEASLVGETDATLTRLW
jgi:NAD(P)H-hydrate epimerase